MLIDTYINITFSGNQEGSYVENLEEYSLIVERGLDDQDFHYIAEASTWIFLNCTDEG